MKTAWFRRLTSSPTDQQTTTAEKNGAPTTGDGDLLGFTGELIEFVKTFTVDTFKDFQLQRDLENGGGDESPSAVRTELYDWQARHATLVLSKDKELSNLRYTLCPWHLQEHMFWEIYFRLVQPHVKKYEQHAIRQEQIKKIAMERKSKAPQDNGFEVEMAETKRECSSSSSIPLDQL